MDKFPYIFYRGETIERLEKGYVWMEETCKGNISSPIYKTIEDAKNAIRKHLDGTHTAEPRVIGEYIWQYDKRTWYAVIA